MDIVSLINTLGYPAAITLGMAYFLKYVFDKNSKQSDEMLEVIKNNTEALTGMKELVETIAESGVHHESCD